MGQVNPGQVGGYVPNYDVRDYEKDLRARRLQTEAERHIIANWLTESEYCLDLGGGYGRITEVLEPRFRRTFMIDYSSRELRVASTRLARTTLIRGDIRKIPFEDNTFDCVVIIKVLHHIKEPREMIEEVVRVARNGGTVIMGVMNLRLGLREARVIEENEQVWVSPQNIRYYMRSPSVYEHTNLRRMERRATGILDNRLGHKLNRFPKIAKIDEVTSRLWFLPRALKPEHLVLYRVAKKRGKLHEPRVICTCGGAIIDRTCSTCHRRYGNIIDLTEAVQPLSLK